MCLEQFLKNAEKNLSDVVSDRDLIQAFPKIFPRPHSLIRLRILKISPPYLKLSNGRVVYLKADVLAWLRGNYCVVESGGRDDVKP